MALYFSGHDKDGTHRISGGSSPEPIKAKPIRTQSMVAYRDLEEDWTDNNIPFHGSLEDTILDSIQVIVGGTILDSSQYRFDFEKKVIQFGFSLMPKHLYVELRSMQPSLGKSASVIIDNVLVLPVCKYVKQRHLPAYLPDFGDKVSIERIRMYEQNASIVEKIKGLDLAQIIDAKVKEDGIYATVKFSIQQ